MSKMERCYSFGNVSFCIHGDESFMNLDALSNFKSEKNEKSIHYYFELVDELSECVGNFVYQDAGIYVTDKCKYFGSVSKSYKNAYMRVFMEDGNYYVQVLKSELHGPLGAHVVYRALDCERLMSKVGVILLHGSYIEVNHQGIVFTAPSGTGKSTQADLWVKYRSAVIINGDRCSIDVLNKKVMGVPFAGSSKISFNTTLPLSCIVYLKQSKTNSIRELTGIEAFKRLWEGIGVQKYDQESVSVITLLVSEIIKNIPIYELSCDMSEDAVNCLESVL